MLFRSTVLTVVPFLERFPQRYISCPLPFLCLLLPILRCDDFWTFPSIINTHLSLFGWRAPFGPLPLAHRQRSLDPCRRARIVDLPSSKEVYSTVQLMAPSALPNPPSLRLLTGHSLRALNCAARSPGYLFHFTKRLPPDHTPSSTLFP